MWDALTSLLPEKKGDRRLVILALAALAVVLGFLFGPSRVVDSEKGAPIGTIEPSDRARRRHARNLFWSDLGSTEQLYEGDYVYVPKGHTASVQLTSASKAIEIPSDTLVQFDRSMIEGIVVNLVAGPPRFYLRQGASRLLAYLPAMEPYELRHQEFTQRFNKRVLGPSPAQSTNSNAFKPLPLSSLSQFEIALLAPEPGQRFRHGPQTWIDVNWTPIPLSDVQFELQIAKDPDFRFMAPYQSLENGVALLFREEGKYFWRVMARRGMERLLSKPSSFEVSRFAPTLKLLDKLGAKISGNILLEVAEDSKFRRLVLSQMGLTKRCPEEGLRSGTMYYCRVTDSLSKRVLDEYGFKAP